mmetsp:Transcript_14844/g.56164  ORF Transcript_14844/g.56164 Transcript_14844/m.56164 type:complete len:1303 (+) Transcript_14844:9620-13528(+)
MLADVQAFQELDERRGLVLQGAVPSDFRVRIVHGCPFPEGPEGGTNQLPQRELVPQERRDLRKASLRDGNPKRQGRSEELPQLKPRLVEVEDLDGSPHLGFLWPRGAEFHVLLFVLPEEELAVRAHGCQALKDEPLVRRNRRAAEGAQRGHELEDAVRVKLVHQLRRRKHAGEGLEDLLYRCTPFAADLRQPKRAVSDHLREARHDVVRLLREDALRHPQVPRPPKSLGRRRENLASSRRDIHRLGLGRKCQERRHELVKRLLGQRIEDVVLPHAELVQARAPLQDSVGGQHATHFIQHGHPGLFLLVDEAHDQPRVVVLPGPELHKRQRDEVQGVRAACQQARREATKLNLRSVEHRCGIRKRDAQRLSEAGLRVQGPSQSREAILPLRRQGHLAEDAGGPVLQTVDGHVLRSGRHAVRLGNRRLDEELEADLQELRPIGLVVGQKEERSCRLGLDSLIVRFEAEHERIEDLAFRQLGMRLGDGSELAEDDQGRTAGVLLNQGCRVRHAACDVPERLPRPIAHDVLTDELLLHQQELEQGDRTGTLEAGVCAPDQKTRLLHAVVANERLAGGLLTGRMLVRLALDVELCLRLVLQGQEMEGHRRKARGIPVLRVTIEQERSQRGEGPVSLLDELPRIVCKGLLGDVGVVWVHGEGEATLCCVLGGLHRELPEDRVPVKDQVSWPPASREGAYDRGAGLVRIQDQPIALPQRGGGLEVDVKTPGEGERYPLRIGHCVQPGVHRFGSRRDGDPLLDEGPHSHRFQQEALLAALSNVLLVALGLHLFIDLNEFVRHQWIPRAAAFQGEELAALFKVRRLLADLLQPGGDEAVVVRVVNPLMRQEGAEHLAAGQGERRQALRVLDDGLANVVDHAAPHGILVDHDAVGVCLVVVQLRPREQPETDASGAFEHEVKRQRDPLQPLGVRLSPVLVVRRLGLDGDGRRRMHVVQEAEPRVCAPPPDFLVLREVLRHLVQQLDELVHGLHELGHDAQSGPRHVDGLRRAQANHGLEALGPNQPQPVAQTGFRSRSQLADGMQRRLLRLRIVAFHELEQLLECQVVIRPVREGFRLLRVPWHHVEGKPRRLAPLRGGRELERDVVGQLVHLRLGGDHVRLKARARILRRHGLVRTRSVEDEELAALSGEAASRGLVHDARVPRGEGHEPPMLVHQDDHLLPPVAEDALELQRLIGVVCVCPLHRQHIVPRASLLHVHDGSHLIFGDVLPVRPLGASDHGHASFGLPVEDGQPNRAALRRWQFLQRRRVHHRHVLVVGNIEGHRQGGASAEPGVPVICKAKQRLRRRALAV